MHSLKCHPSLRPTSAWRLGLGWGMGHFLRLNALKSLEHKFLLKFSICWFFLTKYLLESFSICIIFDVFGFWSIFNTMTIIFIHNIYLLHDVIMTRWNFAPKVRSYLSPTIIVFEIPWTLTMIIGPLQLAIHVLQDHWAGEQKSHWDKTNKRHT